MGTKENASVNQLLSLLESRYAIRVLWALRDGHPQTFRLLQDSVGDITPNTLNTRVKEMREAGLMMHGNEGYCVTASGADLLRRLSDLQAFASKWVANKSAADLAAAVRIKSPKVAAAEAKTDETAKTKAVKKAPAKKASVKKAAGKKAAVKKTVAKSATPKTAPAKVKKAK